MILCFPMIGGEKLFPVQMVLKFDNLDWSLVLLSFHVFVDYPVSLVYFVRQHGDKDCLCYFDL